MLPWGNKKFVIYILKMKFQLLDAFSITIIQFNIIKFDNHDCMIFQDCDHPWHGINDFHHGINDYGHGYDKMT